MQLDWTPRYGNVNAIVQRKKSLNLGEIPEQFQIVANKLKELEGTFTDGFDNNIKFLLNKRNWHLENCKLGKPPVALRKNFTQHAFDLHCFPIVNDEAQAFIQPFDANSPFKEFNPSVVGPVLSIPKLIDFIGVAIRCGDEADIELLKYAHILVEQIVEVLSTSLQVEENSGQSIQALFLSLERQLKDLHA